MKRKVVVLLLTVCMAGSSVALPVHAAPDAGSEKQNVEYQEDQNLDLDFERAEEEFEILQSDLTSGDYTYTLLGNKTAKITKYNGKAKQVAIPATLNGSQVSYIGDDAFSGNASIEVVSFPKSVAYIGKRAFQNCSNLKTVTLNEGLKTIYGGAFSQCTGLKSIVIPSTVTYVGGGATGGGGDGAFEDCSGLTSITLKGTNVGDSMFEGCISLKSVTIPMNVTKVGAASFYGCNALEKVVCEAKGPIGMAAFQGCSKLKSVTLKNTTSIGQEGLAGIPITKIDIPATCESLGYLALSGCKNLSNVTLHDGLKSIGSKAFMDCAALKSITLPGTLNSIGDSAFQTTPLISMTIPKSVNSIGTDAFKHCKNLKSVVFYNSGTIGESAFVDCTALTSIDMSKSNVKTIGDYAFFKAPIKAFVAPKTLNFIGIRAFEETKVESVVLNEGLTGIDNGAFNKCTKLKSVNIPSTVTYCADEDWTLGCFQDCTSLVDVSIKNNLIGREMFAGCKSLKSIVIPDTVQRIDKWAFKGCSSLSYATFLGNAPTTVGEKIFDGTRSGFVICYFDKTSGWSSTWKGYKTKKVTKIPGDGQNVFGDVTPDDWFKDAVNYVYSKGYMSGVKVTEFGPTQPLTRAMFVTVLYNKAKTEGAKAVAYKKTFTDVPNGKWYTEAALWAAQNKITNGIGNKKFGTETLVTREQMATMLYSYAQWKKLSTKADNNALKSFPDGNKVNQWALAGMKWAVTNKIINGKGSGKSAKLDPQGNATRGECAQIIMNFEKTLQKK